jgi:hypothetical protein
VAGRQADQISLPMGIGRFQESLSCWEEGRGSQLYFVSYHHNFSWLIYVPISGRKVTRLDLRAGLCVTGRVTMLRGRTNLDPQSPTTGLLYSGVRGLDQRETLKIWRACSIRRCAGLTFFAGGSGDVSETDFSKGWFHRRPTAALGEAIGACQSDAIFFGVCWGLFTSLVISLSASDSISVSESKLSGGVGLSSPAGAL